MPKKPPRATSRNDSLGTAPGGSGDVTVVHRGMSGNLDVPVRGAVWKTLNRGGRGEQSEKLSTDSEPARERRLPEIHQEPFFKGIFQARGVRLSPRARSDPPDPALIRPIRYPYCCLSTGIVAARPAGRLGPRRGLPKFLEEQKSTRLNGRDGHPGESHLDAITIAVSRFLRSTAEDCRRALHVDLADAGAKRGGHRHGDPLRAVVGELHLQLAREALLPVG